MAIGVEMCIRDRYLAAVLCFNRNTVTAVPGSDESVLQIGMQGAVHHAGKLGMDAVGGYGHAEMCIRDRKYGYR